MTTVPYTGATGFGTRVSVAARVDNTGHRGPGKKYTAHRGETPMPPCPTSIFQRLPPSLLSVHASTQATQTRKISFRTIIWL